MGEQMRRAVVDAFMNDKNELIPAADAVPAYTPDGKTWEQHFDDLAADALAAHAGPTPRTLKRDRAGEIMHSQIAKVIASKPETKIMPSADVILEKPSTSHREDAMRYMMAGQPRKPQIIDNGNYTPSIESITLANRTVDDGKPNLIQMWQKPSEAHPEGYTGFSVDGGETWIQDGTFEPVTIPNGEQFTPVGYGVDWGHTDSQFTIIAQGDASALADYEERARLERQVIETAMAVHAITVPDMDAFNAAVVARDEACEALARWREENP